MTRTLALRELGVKLQEVEEEQFQLRRSLDAVTLAGVRNGGGSVTALGELIASLHTRVHVVLQIAHRLRSLRAT